MWKDLGVRSSFTWETSQYAYTDNGEIIRFDEADYKKLAIEFMETFNEYEEIIDKGQNNIKYFITKKDAINEEVKEKNKSKLKTQVSKIMSFHKLIKNAQIKAISKEHSKYFHYLMVSRKKNDLDISSKSSDKIESKFERKLPPIPVDPVEEQSYKSFDNIEVTSTNCMPEARGNKFKCVLSKLKEPRSIQLLLKPSLNPILSNKLKNMLSFDYTKKNRELWNSRIVSENSDKDNYFKDISFNEPQTIPICNVISTYGSSNNTIHKIGRAHV